MNTLYQLNQDPVGYWILYDYLIENGWADINLYPIGYYTIGYGSHMFSTDFSFAGLSSYNYSYSQDTYKDSSSDGLMRSCAGYHCYSVY